MAPAAIGGGVPPDTNGWPLVPGAFHPWINTPSLGDLLTETTARFYR